MCAAVAKGEKLIKAKKQRKSIEFAGATGLMYWLLKLAFCQTKREEQASNKRNLNSKDADFNNGGDAEFPRLTIGEAGCGGFRNRT